MSTDPLYKTDAEKILGGNIKGGVNYNINEEHNVFVNSGYYSKQPFFNAVYRNNRSVAFDTPNEKILGLEAGYTFTAKYLTASVNGYRTSWKDRVTTTTTTAATTAQSKHESQSESKSESAAATATTHKLINL